MLTVVVPPLTALPDASVILAACACDRPRCPCQRAERRGRGNTHCPAHPDNTPSCTVTPDEAVGALVHCKAGCVQDDVIEELRRRGAWPEPSRNGFSANGIPKTRWPYAWDTTIVAWHKRIDQADGKKAFSWELPNGKASDGDIAVADLPLYRRAEVLQAPADQVVCVTEGEKAADAVAERGFLATSFAGGASQREFGTALEDLRGRHVVLLPDNDARGCAFMEAVQEALTGVAESIRVLDLPELPEKGDAYEYFQDGHTAHDLAMLIEAGTPVGVTTRVRRFEIIDAPDYLNRPPVRWLVRGLLPECSFVTIVGGPGSYKSFLALHIAVCIALGIPCFGYEARQGSVLYVAGEGAGGFPQRMRSWQHYHKQELPRALKILPRAVPLIDHASVRDLIADIESFGETFELVIVDTLSRALAGEDENASAPMTKAVQAAEMLQQALGCCVIVIHHGRKSDGEIRGHGSLKGALDTVIVMERDQAHNTVKVECSKQKDGEEFKPFSLRPVVVDVTPPMDLHTVGSERVTSLVLERLPDAEEEQRRRGRVVESLKREQRMTLAALATFGETGATSAEWLAKARELMDENTARSTFYRRQEALCEKGLVIVPTTRNNEGIYVATRDARAALGDATLRLG